MKKINIQFKSSHLLDGEEETLNYNVAGTMIESDKYKIISYIEPDKDVNDRTLIKYNDDEFKLIRTGSVQSEMCFRKKGESLGLYSIDNYTFQLNIGIRGLIIKKDSIKVEYDLFVNNEYSGLFKLIFNIKE